VHPVNKKILDIADVSWLATGSKYADSKHVMQLSLMKLVIEILVDVQDVHNC